MQNKGEQKIIEGFRITADGYTYTLINEGQGGFLNPPGDLEHFMCVASSRSGVIGPNSDRISLRGCFADWATYIPQEVKDAVKQRLDANPGDCKDEFWIRGVYNYFRSMYTKDAAIRNVNDRENVYSYIAHDYPLLVEAHARENAERHLGYLFVKQFDPEATPRMDLILRNWKETPPYKGEPWAPQPKQQTEATQNDGEQS